MKERQTQSFVAILCSLCLGMIFSAAMPGCQDNSQVEKVKAKAESVATTEKAAPVSPAPANNEKEATEPAQPATETKAPIEKVADQPTADATPPTTKPAEEKQPATSSVEPKSTSEAVPAGNQSTLILPTKNPVATAGDWNQWGGNSLRNNVAIAKTGSVPTEWEPGEFDQKTGDWDKASSKNIKWVAKLGSQTYGNTVVAGGRVFVGTNNYSGYLKRYPTEIDLGCLIAFDEKTGKFLWQHSSEKLPTGRVHDWPLMGICCSPLVEGDHVWFVTSRGEIKCLDAQGFYDNEDDGPVKNESGRLFDLMKSDEAKDDKFVPAVKELNEGKVNDALRELFKTAGFELPADITVSVKEAGKAWSFTAKVGDAEREVKLSAQGPRLSAFKIITAADKEEADTIWTVDMMKQLGTSQHNMCSCSVTSWGDLLFVNTSNGVHEDHKTIPAPEAPSFVCMNKNSGEIYWTDSSPRDNILHGQWSSPAVAIIKDVPQVIFGGGDGWVYSFRADTGKDGKGELLWKFDINEKDSLLELGGRGTRNDIIATPVVYDDKVYFATGQDPEHGEGKGIYWCIDPTKRGDISEYLAVNASDPNNVKELPPRRVQAILKDQGDKAIPNPNSGVVWKLTEQDWCNDSGEAKPDGKIDDFMEKFHRGIGTCAIKDNLLFVADFSGLFFCIDAQTGKIHWAHDMLAASWGSPLIADGKVMIGDEDGDIVVFECKAEQHEPLTEINMKNSVYSSPIIANDTLYIANRDHLFAIAIEKSE
jgi:outer membrane protein assembly factor BamB